jgi:serine/threonine protein kinase
MSETPDHPHSPNRTTTDFGFTCECGAFRPSAGQPQPCSNCGRSNVDHLETQGLTQTVDLGRAQQPTPVDSAAAEPLDFLPAGTRIGHFEILELLGAGGMGAVYLAVDISLQRHVALKLIQTSQLGAHTGERIARLKQEAVAQARLNHPNVVTIYFVGEEQGQPYFAMELIGGHTLAEIRRQGPIPYRELAEIAYQITLALEHAQAFQLVHGDIKPSNVLLDEQHKVKLSDFGLARFLNQDSSSLGAISGTLNYLAPEAFTGTPANVQSDMYALGVSLFELTYGSVPFPSSGKSLQEKIEAAQNRELNFPEGTSETPEGWRELIQQLLSPDPDHRFESYQQLKQRLDRLRVKPQVAAGRFPRVFAYGIDFLTAWLFFGLTSTPYVLAQLLVDENQLQWLSSMLFLGSPVGLLLYSLIEIQSPKTPGRYLFQLQIVDNHGHRPQQSRRLARHLLRMSFIWTTCLASWIPAALSWLAFPAIVASQLFLLADAATVLLGPAGLSLHDGLCGTRVVLDRSPDEPIA